MLWFIIGIIIVTVVVIRMIFDVYCDLGEILSYGFLMLIAAMSGAFMLTAFSGMIADACADKTWSVVEDVEIHALQDNVTTEGNFFLGSGHIDKELKYFYVEETDLGYTVSNVDADDAYIRYTNDRCRLERQTYEFNNPWVYLVAIPLGERYVFYIPEGSIINNYSVDLG